MVPRSCLNIFSFQMGAEGKICIFMPTSIAAELCDKLTDLVNTIQDSVSTVPMLHFCPQSSAMNIRQGTHLFSIY